MDIVCRYRGLWIVALVVAGMIAFAPLTAYAGEATAKIVWVDLKNSALLIVCENTEACKDIPKSKKGEMYTFVIPNKLKGSAKSWKEGTMVKFSFKDREGGGWDLTNVKGGS